MSNANLQQLIDDERNRFYTRVAEIAIEFADKKPSATSPTHTAPAELEWGPTMGGGKKTHAEALKAIDKLNADAFRGHTDWRLPEIRELLSLVDYTRHDPAIDTERFPDTKSDWYWTASSCAGDPACAWIVGFDYGCADWGGRGSVAFVRAVRGPSARASQ